MARMLVAWWIGSIVVLANLVVPLVLPADVRRGWASWPELRVVALVTISWLVPGLVLGGWKALLVAVGRSPVRTGTDRTLLAAFSVVAVGWPLLIALAAERLGAF